MSRAEDLARCAAIRIQNRRWLEKVSEVVKERLLLRRSQEKRNARLCSRFISCQRQRRQSEQPAMTFQTKAHLRDQRRKQNAECRSLVPENDME